MSSLVIGLGSIGSRHARVLTDLGEDVAVVSSQNDVSFRCYSSISQAIKQEDPQYVVVANVSSAHYETLCQLHEAGFSGKVLVEKPLFINDDHDLLSQFKFSEVSVGFDLRFHPALLALNEMLQNQKSLSAQVYVGQYLPTWRPQTDYRQSYSANSDLGGGVLWDLSHEFDYVNWIFGSWKRLTAMGGHLSALEIDTPDSYSVLLETERCPMVTVNVNYLDRIFHRNLIVNTETCTMAVDFMQSTLTFNYGESVEVKKYELDIDFVYREQHRSILNSIKNSRCLLNDGLESVNTILAIEKAAANQTWVTR